MERSDSGGYIKLHRSLLDHRLWTRSRFTQGQAWVDLLLLASHKAHTVLMGTRVVEVGRGEVLTSQVKLAKRWRWDRETVLRFFHAIGSLGMTSIRTSKQSETGYTIVTILNYDAYQGDGIGQPLNSAASDAASDNDQNPASVPHPCHTIKKGKELRGDAHAVPAGRRRSHRSNGRGAPEGYQETVDAWFAMFEAAKGNAPQFDQAEGASLKRLITRHGPQAVQQGMRQLLYHTRLRGIVDHHRYSLKTLAGFWNELASEAQARGRAEGVE